MKTKTIIHKYLSTFNFFISVTFFLTISILLTGCNSKKEILSDTKFYFDTAVTITLYDSNSTILNECFNLCNKYEKMFSNTIETSEISQINNNSKYSKFTTVSDETIELINSGILYGKLTNGKFDITIGNLSSLWNFSSDSPKVPEMSNLTDIISHIDYHNIIINGNDVLLSDSKANLDLGGIAKGYIADKLKEYLKSQNVKSGIINLGGNIMLLGSKPDKSDYNIGLQKPFAADDEVIAVVKANDISIVTSGIYERYFYENNILYHHILDNSTGYPVENNLLAVTIISKSSVDGDGLSTSAFIMGIDKGMELIEGIDGIEAVFIDNNYKLHLTSGLNIKDNIISIKNKS